MWQGEGGMAREWDAVEILMFMLMLLPLMKCTKLPHVCVCLSLCRSGDWLVGLALRWRYGTNRCQHQLVVLLPMCFCRSCRVFIVKWKSVPFVVAPRF